MRMHMCVCVRACAALTCRLLTAVFVCTQASELRGPPVLPLLPSEPRPCLRHFSDLAVFHCLVPTDPAGLPARTHPSLPTPTRQHPGIAPWGPCGPCSPSGHVTVQAGNLPRWTGCLEGVAMRGPTPISFFLHWVGAEGGAGAEHTHGLLLLLLLLITVCPSVCLSVCL